MVALLLRKNLRESRSGESTARHKAVRDTRSAAEIHTRVSFCEKHGDFCGYVCYGVNELSMCGDATLMFLN